MRGARPLAWAAMVACLAVASAGLALPVRAQDLWIRNARLFDGTGAPPSTGVSIVIRGGRIAAVGPDVAAAGASELDAAGTTVLPGLIDAHVHLSSVPGAGQRDDPQERLDTLVRHHLRAYLACGVTTVLDAAIPPDFARRLLDWIEDGAPAPRVLMLTPTLPAPGGYATYPEMGLYFPPVATPAEVERAFEETADLRRVGVKILIEHGFGPVKIWPTHAAEMREAIVRIARERGVPIYVHGFSEEEQSIALELAPRALVHGGFDEEEPSEGFVRRLAASGTYVIPTLAVYDALLMAHEPDRFDDPLLVRTVPAVELETARDPEAWRRMARAAMVLGTPAWVPEFLHGLLARIFATERRARSSLASSSEAIRRFHDAGVPIVAGSDSGNWPVIPYFFHGPTTLREIELLTRAGLSNEEALLAATRVAAEMLGIADESGTVELGKRADLVAVRGDPVADVRALRDVAFTVRAGVADTPDGWLARGTD